MKNLSHALILSMLVLVVPFGLNGQETVVDSLSADPEAMEMVDVAEASESVRVMVNRAEGRLASNESLSNLDSILDATETNFRALIESYETFRQGSPNLQKLDSERNILERANGAREQWQSSTRSFLERANTSRETLSDELGIWELTRESAVASGVPNSLLGTIDETIDVLEEAIAETSRQINIALDLSARIVDQKNELTATLDDLEDWSNSGELNIFYKRHEAIWKTSFKRDPNAGAPPALDTVQTQSDAIKGFAINFTGQLYIFLIVVVLLTLLVNFIKRRSEGVTSHFPNERMNKARDVVSKYSVSTITYLSALVAYFYLKNLPDVISELMMVLLLLTTYILIKPFVFKRFNYSVLLIFALYLLDEAKTYIWFTSANYRVYLYVEALAALGVLGFYLRRSMGIQDLPATVINKIIRFGVYILVLLNIGAFVTNTFGYTNMTDILLRVSVSSSSVSVVALGIVYVLGGVIGTSVAIYFSDQKGFTEGTIDKLQHQTQRIVKWLAILFWTSFVLTSAELLTPVVKGLDLWLTEPWTFGEFSLTPKSLIMFFVVIIVTGILTKAIAVAIDGGALGFLRIKKGTLDIISMILRYTIVAFAIAIALGSLGIDLSKFGLIAGALGVGIGFGLQNIVGNFIAGMILIFEQPIKKGDTIEVAGLLGIVLNIGVRSSIIKSFDGADIVIPNGTLLSNNLVNWTHADTYKRVEVEVGVAYGTDPNVVAKLLVDVAMNYENAEIKPPPMALFQQFGGSSIDFKLLFWVHVDHILTARSDVTTLVYERLAEDGIEIPFPRRDITILSDASGED